MMMMMMTTGYVSSSIFWRTSIIPTFWVETSPWTLPGQELSSILWSFASFVVAPRADIVSDFCETLVQRTGSWGWWLEVERIQSLYYIFIFSVLLDWLCNHWIVMGCMEGFPCLGSVPKNRIPARESSLMRFFHRSKAISNGYKGDESRDWLSPPPKKKHQQT